MQNFLFIQFSQFILIFNYFFFNFDFFTLQHVTLETQSILQIIQHILYLNYNWSCLFDRSAFDLPFEIVETVSDKIFTQLFPRGIERVHAWSGCCSFSLTPHAPPLCLSSPEGKCEVPVFFGHLVVWENIGVF